VLFVWRAAHQDQHDRLARDPWSPTSSPGASGCGAREILLRDGCRCSPSAPALAWVNLHGNPSHGAEYQRRQPVGDLAHHATVIPRYLWLVVAAGRELASYYATPLRASWLSPDRARGSTLFIRPR